MVQFAINLLQGAVPVVVYVTVEPTPTDGSISLYAPQIVFGWCSTKFGNKVVTWKFSPPLAAAILNEISPLLPISN